jgi:hypothetical protein
LSEVETDPQPEEAHLKQMITVTPFSKGWTIKCTARERNASFRSGAAAEAAAHSLGAEIARAGDTAVIEIFLRDGALGGRYVHAPKAWNPPPEVRAAGAPFSESPQVR